MSILNASPQVVLLGTDDKSTRIVTPTPEPIPQHLPKFYLYAKKGPTEPVLAGGARMLALYDGISFDKLSPYYNHATRFAVGIAGEANTLMTQRVIPDDAGPEANFTLYIDVIDDEVPNYLRNSDGSLVADTSGNYLTDPTTPTIPGHRIKYIKEYDPAGLTLGSNTLKTGNMTNGNGDTSTMYPIMDFKANYKGEYYNNVGISIESLPFEAIPSTIMTAGKMLPYKLKLVTRKDPLSTPVVVNSLYGEKAVSFTMKRDGINPLTEAGFDLDAIFPEQWSNETDPLLPMKYSDYEDTYMYYDNVEVLLNKLIEVERTHITNVPTTWEDGNSSSTAAWYDFTTVDQDILLRDELHLFGLFTAKSSKNVRYMSVVHDDSAVTTTATMKEVQVSANTPLFLEGGSDGTLDNINYETLVTRELAKYLDADSEVMEMAINVESIIYDSGFTLATKKEICNFIALRKDTMVSLTTHDATLGTKYLPLSDERAIAVNLRTRLKLTPESDYFGTSVMRGIIVGGTGLLSDGSSKNRIPLLYEIAVKSAKYMGAGNGEWKAVYNFDNAPGNIINVLKDVQPAFIPAGVKPVIWAAGLIWAQPFNRRQFFFPGLQTVYDNDTSVLNSYFTVMAICTLNKVAAEAWRNFSGTSSFTEAQLSDAVVSFVKGRLLNKFDNRFEIIPEVVFTATDKQRGYSWNLITKIYANNMKTVMVSRVEAYRLEN